MNPKILKEYDQFLINLFHFLMLKNNSDLNILEFGKEFSCLLFFIEALITDLYCMINLIS